MKRIAVFVSGSGSDMQSVIDACEAGRINGKVVFMTASKDGIYAIERAKKHGIDYAVFPKNDYETAEARDLAILEQLKEHRIDLVVLAGYLSIVTPVLVEAYRGRMINIHPSLIPKHAGKGFYGMRVHQSVLEAGDTVSGATVHFVDEGTDTGAVILQREVSVLGDDTPESLQARVLQLEHTLLPEAVAMLCTEEV